MARQQPGSPEHTLSVIGYTNFLQNFHTPYYQKEVANDFDAQRFAKRLRAANTDSVVFFAKCYRGFSYYDTKVGTKHPHLKTDMLEAAVKACHENGMKILPYLSIALDNVAAEQNPDWVLCDEQGRRSRAIHEGASGWVCLNSPYTEEIFWPQLQEVLEYDVDGIFFDELFYAEGCCTCPYCRKNMTDLGMNPEDPEQRRSFLARTFESFTERTTKIIKTHNEKLVVVYNATTELLGMLPYLAKMEDFVLAEGHEAQWCSTLSSIMRHRYIRNLSRPVQAMTGIFHELWGDCGTVKNEARLMYEIGEMLSHHFRVSIGDDVEPHGRLNNAKTDLVSVAFKRVKDLSLPEVTPCRDIAVVYPGRHTYAHRTVMERNTNNRYELEKNGLSGATKLLTDAHQQFDVLDEELAVELVDDFNLIILPATGELNPAVVDKIRNFVHEGGSLLVTGNSSLTKGGFDLSDVLGVEHDGKSLPYSAAYFDFEDYDSGMPDIDCIAYGNFVSITPRTAVVKASITAPSGGGRRYAVRNAGPPGRKLNLPAITHNRYGKGEVIYIATDLFRQYFEKDYHGHRILLNNIVTSLQKKRFLAAEAPTSVVVNAMQSPESIYVHLTSYHTGHQGGTFALVSDYPPPIDVKVRIHAPSAGDVTPVTKVDIESVRDDEYLEISCRGITTHEVIRIESG